MNLPRSREHRRIYNFQVKEGEGDGEGWRNHSHQPLLLIDERPSLLSRDLPETEFPYHVSWRAKFNNPPRGEKGDYSRALYARFRMDSPRNGHTHRYRFPVDIDFRSERARSGLTLFFPSELRNFKVRGGGKCPLDRVNATIYWQFF